MKNAMTTLALLLAFTAPAMANEWKNTDAHIDAKAKTEAFIQTHDKDGDGFVSKEENSQWSANDFHKADTDGDGKLSSTEIKAFNARLQSESKTGM